MRRPEALNKIISVLRSVAPDAEAILYGSEARGEARPDSDFDLLILLPTAVTPSIYEKITNPLFDLLWDEGINVSPIVYSKVDWETRRIVTPFSLSVGRDGIRI